MKFKSNMNCCVPQCTAYHRKNPELSFHGFPSNEVQRKQWIHVLKIGKKPGKHAKVCSRHFRSKNYKTLLSAGKTRQYLLKAAIPDLNLPVASCQPNQHKAAQTSRSRTMRVMRRQNAKSLDNVVAHPEKDDGTSSDEGSPPGDLMPAEPSSAPVLESNNDPAIIFTSEAGTQANLMLEEMLRGPNFMDRLTTDASMKTMTGLESVAMFNGIVQCVKRIRGGDVERDVVLTMMKLKHNVSHAFLSVCFSVSQTRVASIFTSTVLVLADVLGEAITWPSAEEVRMNMPTCFKQYQATRVVLDCTEFNIQTPKCLRCRILTYSNYKGHQTCKVMVGVSPAGLITNVSVPWGGKASDKEIFQKSNLVDSLEPYLDAVMVDKGFHIEMELEERGIKMFRPPFLRNKRQLTKVEAKATAEIAAARVHVERVIGRMKVFTILSGMKITWGMLPYVEAIVKVIAGVTNLSRPVFADKRFM